MTGTVVTHKTQVGQSGTAANNFTIRTLDDGSLRVSRGNAGAEISDVLVIDANGNFSTAPVLGTGQTWQNVTASRANNTNYTNTTGRPIMLIVHAATMGNSVVLSLTVGGIVVSNAQWTLSSGSLIERREVSAIVPAGTSYSVTYSNITDLVWVELR